MAVFNLNTQFTKPVWDKMGKYEILPTWIFTQLATAQHLFQHITFTKPNAQNREKYR